MIANSDLITIRTVVVTATTRSVQLLMVESGLTAGMSLSVYSVSVQCHHIVCKLLSLRASLTGTDDRNL